SCRKVRNAGRPPGLRDALDRTLQSRTLQFMSTNLVESRLRSETRRAKYTPAGARFPLASRPSHVTDAQPSERAVRPAYWRTSRPCKSKMPSTAALASGIDIRKVIERRAGFA